METTRRQYFESLQSRLQFSSDFGYSCLRQTVISEISNYKKYDLPEVRQIHTDTFDYISKEIYPMNDDLCTGFLPIRIYGDGNCQCRTGSMYLFGSEDNHIEIRCHIIMEMVIQKDWYLADKEFHKYAQFSESFRPSDDLKDLKGIKEIYDRTVLKFTRKDTWGDMWTLIALTSILGCTVYSIYPDLLGTQRDRKLMHMKIKPREARATEIVRIMWTTLLRNSASNRWWLPNHFVACAASTTTACNPKRPNLTLGDFFTFKTPTCMSSKTAKRERKDRKAGKQLNQSMGEHVDLTKPERQNEITGAFAKVTQDSMNEFNLSSGNKEMKMQAEPLDLKGRKSQDETPHSKSLNKNLPKFDSIDLTEDTPKCGSTDFPKIFSQFGSLEQKENSSEVACQILNSKAETTSFSELTPNLKTEHFMEITSEVDSSIFNAKTSEMVYPKCTDAINFMNEHIFVSNPQESRLTQSEVGSKDSKNIILSQPESIEMMDFESPEIVSQHPTEINSSESEADSTNAMDTSSECDFQDQIDVISSKMSYVDAVSYNVSNEFYYRMGRLASLNRSRDKTRNFFPVFKDSNNQNVSVKRTDNIEDTVAFRLSSLKKKILWEIKPSKRAHLAAVMECGSYLLENGPVVKTQILCGVLKNTKASYRDRDADNKKRKLSIELLETLSKYLPVMQIYICGTGYIMEYREGDVQGFIDTISNAVNQQELATKNLESTLDNFKDYLKFTDTQLDKSIIRSILVELYSVNSVSRLPGSKCKETLRRARDEIPRKMKKFKSLRRKLLSVRNDMTNKQQHSFYSRRVSKMKAKTFKARAKGGGRQKIAEKFPQLAEVLELAFGEGSKIHPRLENDTRYKNPDLALTMSQAREILLTAASEKIPNIALSTCYTYTQNFRRNTLQAKRHHYGEDVNAKISLKKLPRVGMMEERINAHYCRANVNFQLEKAAADKINTLVDAKDAKGIVCADIDPVQNIGKSWLNKTRQDHQFDQSRTNACTPMTHLFLQTVTTNTVIKSSNLTVMNVVRTGQPVTLINISFFEPETVFRCFNEVFHLLSIPALDIFFRNQETGKLRRKWIFVVDNGPSEAPASTLIRMMLVRLVNFLDLEKATQISFEKLNSKDNPAERPHASENLVLSKHGPFKSAEIFPNKNAKPGTPKHRENMEAMAEQVISCLRSAKFGQNQFFCFRGVKDNYLFNDEIDIRNFLKLSEQSKNECMNEYKVVDCPLLTNLSQTWGVQSDFSGSYMKDYNQLCNSVVDNVRTAWLTEYCATIFTKKTEDIHVERYVQEPLPDFLRWYESNGELHYMCYESRQQMPLGDWDSEELFLPSKITSLLNDLNTCIPDSVIDSASLLVWLTPEQLKEELKKLQDKLEHSLENDKSRELWKNHDLYKKTVASLQLEAKNLNIPYTVKHSKTDLTQLIAEKKNLKLPNEANIYDGKLVNVPTDVNSLTNLSTYELRQILKYHNLNYGGNKDELVMKVFLLRHKRSYMSVESTINKLSKIAEIAVSVIIWQKRFYNDIKHVYRQRQFSTIKGSTKSVINIPEHISDKNLTEIFDPLFDWLDTLLKVKWKIDQERKLDDDDHERATANPYEQCKETGAKIKVYWSREEIGTFKWDIGWYFAHVVSYDEDFDSIEIEYVKEPGCIYTIDFTPHFLNGKLKFVSSPFYS